MHRRDELQQDGDGASPAGDPAYQDEPPERPSRQTQPHVVKILRELIVAIVAAVVIAAATGQHFAAVLVVGGGLLLALQLLELAGWWVTGRVRGPSLAPGIWRWLSVRLAASLALCPCGVLIARTAVLAPLAAGLFVTVLIAHTHVLSALPDTSPKDLRPGWRKRGGWALRFMRDDERGSAELQMTMPDSAVRMLNFAADGLARLHGLPPLVGLLAGVGLILCAIAFGAGALTGHWEVSPSSPRQGRGPVPRLPHQTPTPTPTPPTPPTPSSARWNGVCPPAGEQTLAPRWQRDAETLRTFYERESRLGPPEEGCLGPLSTHTGPGTGTGYAAANGSNPLTLRPLSFAIVSAAFGLAMFREPAAAWVERLVAQLEGPVGGVGRFPDYPVRAGDYDLVRTPRGIYVLVRESEDAEYVELPPTVAQAWLAMMKERHAWLWPEPPRSTRDGEFEYPIYSDETPEAPEGSIRLDPRSAEATRAGISYLASVVREIGLGELQALAKRA